MNALAAVALTTLLATAAVVKLLRPADFVVSLELLYGERLSARRLLALSALLPATELAISVGLLFAWTHALLRGVLLCAFALGCCFVLTTVRAARSRQGCGCISRRAESHVGSIARASSVPLASVLLMFDDGGTPLWTSAVHAPLLASFGVILGLAAAVAPSALVRRSERAPTGSPVRQHDSAIVSSRRKFLTRLSVGGLGLVAAPQLNGIAQALTAQPGVPSTDGGYDYARTVELYAEATKTPFVQNVIRDLEAHGLIIAPVELASRRLRTNVYNADQLSIPVRLRDSLAQVGTLQYFTLVENLDGVDRGRGALAFAVVREGGAPLGAVRLVTSICMEGQPASQPIPQQVIDEVGLRRVLAARAKSYVLHSARLSA